MADRPIGMFVSGFGGLIVARAVIDLVPGDDLTVLAERLLAPIRDAEVDTLLLGCTHYPYLARVLSDVLGRDVLLVSSADETAFEVADVMRATGLSNERRAGGAHRWYSSG